MSERVDFDSLVRQLNTRAARSVVSQLALRNPALNGFLRETFEAPPGAPGSFLAEPVFEATFGWKTASQTMASLEGELFSARTLDAFENPPRELSGEYRFQRSWHPYAHQVEAWRALLNDQPRSVLVSSGTGSGKTECFLMPIIEDLARQLAQDERPLVGVNALFLYPLNALINSQRDRLRAWTHRFGGKLRFCLYNGETPREVPAAEAHQQPSQVLSRRDLWDTPPPILVTNATMLEYMLVRTADRPILERSRGQLRWIVLDEAHTYVGSQAAELALLLRRVMTAFEVEPRDVRFVATSATIGGDDADSQARLRHFLARVAGVPEEQVIVVRGARDVPALPGAAQDAAPLHSRLEELSKLPAAPLFERLAANKGARHVRQLVARRPATLAQITDRLREAWPDFSEASALPLLTLLSAARDTGGDDFLPMRVHVFERTLAGIWACANPACPGTQPALAAEAWRFGRLYFNRQDVCDSCTGAVFELVGCTQCGTEYLHAHEKYDEQAKRYELRPLAGDYDLDEFQLDVEREEQASAEGEEYRSRRLLAPGTADRRDWLRFGTAEMLSDAGGADRYPVDLVMQTPGQDGTDAAFRCICCGESKRTFAELFIPKRLGAPFFLGNAIPATLAHCPPSAGAVSRGPFGSRRLITFTDSRQGTARIAARLQQEADRSFVRSEIYHSIAPVAAERQGGLTEAEAADLAQIQARLAAPGLDDFLRDMLKGRMAPLVERQAAAGVVAAPVLTWQDMASTLEKSEAISTWMCDDFKRISGQALEAREFGQFCLLREFGMRSKRANQLETLGLARLDYPKLADSKAPPIWRELGGRDEEWPVFLAMLVDHYVRYQRAVDIPDHYLQWMGARQQSRLLQGPQTDVLPTRGVRWPAVRNPRRPALLVNLVARAFAIDLEDQGARNRVSLLFAQAWDGVRPLLSSFPDGYQLDLARHAVITAPATGWRCPYSRRILPRTLRELSPYTPVAHAQPDRCEPVAMPVLPLRYWRDDAGRVTPDPARQTWLDADAVVQSLREQMLWPNLSDRIAAREPWYAVAEHSAQQPRKRLQRLEKQFKEGRINVLSCSTTMEMGVDIGGMSAVVMNNAPPSQANYLQRAGRAGRRKESASAAVTLCKQTAHGMEVFANPLWPFAEGALAVPQVRLSSAPIVQRHVNALLLGCWMRERREDAPKLNCAWFYDADEGSPSRVDGFMAWCRGCVDARQERLYQALDNLTRHSALERVGSAELIERVVDQVTLTRQAWQRDLAPLLEQRARLEAESPSPQTLPAYRAIGYQLGRLRQEYLLKELTGRGFLPGHGFPVGIVSFIPTTAADLRRTETEREDNLGWTSLGPSRPLSVAIREYAPGADVVLDGRVYNVGGVTLNWHIPTGVESVREIQSIRQVWFCEKCGAGGTAFSRPEVCASCGNGDQAAINVHELLEPGGFAVDLFYQPHNDVNFPRFLPYRDPRISIADAAFRALPNAQLGRTRYSDQGAILHWNPGEQGQGYAVCLQCGRAAEEQGGDMPPKIFQHTHYPLRGGKDRDGKRECAGSANDWAIKRRLWLGASQQTGVFELQINDPHTGEAIRDEGVAWSIGFALRYGLVTRLGIEDAEVSVAVQSYKPSGGELAYTLFLYDTAASGAGFVAQLLDDFKTVVTQAMALLDCHAACDKACNSCLLAWDSQHRNDLLDRKAALAFLQAWWGFLALPDAQRHFGAESTAEIRDLLDVLRINNFAEGVTETGLFLGGDPSEWALAEWSLLADLQRWCASGRRVCLYIDPDSAFHLPSAARRTLQSLQSLYGDRFEAGVLRVANALNGHARVLAYVRGHRDHVWAAQSPSLVPGAHWGQTEEVIVRGNLPQLAFPVDPLDLELQPDSVAADGATVSLRIRGELDGELVNFGSRFWDHLCQASPSLGHCMSTRRIETVTVTDRYLRSPWHVALLNAVLTPLWKEARPAVQINVMACPESERRSRVTDNWTHESTRNDILRTVLEDSLGRAVSLNSGSKREIAHSRSLVLGWEGGSATTILLDEGFGCWDTRGYASFDFGAGLSQQVRQIARLKGAPVVMRQRELGTWIHVLGSTPVH